MKRITSDDSSINRNKGAAMFEINRSTTIKDANMLAHYHQGLVFLVDTMTGAVLGVGFRSSPQSSVFKAMLSLLAAQWKTKLSNSLLPCTYGRRPLS